MDSGFAVVAPRVVLYVHLYTRDHRTTRSEFASYFCISVSAVSASLYALVFMLAAVGCATDIGRFKEVEEPSAFIASLRKRMFVRQFSGNEHHRLSSWIHKAWDTLTVRAKSTNANYEFSVRCKKCGRFVHQKCGGDTSSLVWEKSIHVLQSFMTTDVGDDVSDDVDEW